MPALWPTVWGGIDGSNASIHPGPVEGRVASRWDRPLGAYARGPVIAQDGRVGIVDGSGFSQLAPDLRPLVDRTFEQPPRGVSATAAGFLVCAMKDVHRISAEDSSIVGTVPHLQFTPDGAFELPDGSLVAWQGNTIVRLAGGVHVSTYLTAQPGFVSTSSVAVHGERVWSARAMSWSSSDFDEPTEYYAELAAFELATGERLSAQSHDDGLPTGTGSSLRLMAAPGCGALSEAGSAVYSEDGRQRWRTLASGPCAIAGGSLLIAGDQKLLSAPLDGAPARTLRELPPGGIRALAVAARHAYLALEDALIALSLETGDEVFRLEPLSALALAIGDGYLIARTRDGLIRIH